MNALVVKLVDTTDLKSVPFWSASSSLAEGTINDMTSNLQFLRACVAISEVYLYILIGYVSYSIYLVKILAITCFYKLITYLNIKTNNNISPKLFLFLSVAPECFLRTFIKKKF